MNNLHIKAKLKSATVVNSWKLCTYMYCKTVLFVDFLTIHIETKQHYIFKFKNIVRQETHLYTD